MKISPIETTEQRLDRLEARVAEIAAALGRLDASAAQGAPVPLVLPAAAAAPVEPPQPLPGTIAEAEPAEETFSPDLIPNTNTILAV
ncbi:MAG TPA: hypothetical protein VIZ69_13465, partial [Thermoanaerobaculia bacterium]